MITDAILASQVHYLFSYRGLCLSSIRCESGLECSSTGGCCRGVFQRRPCASGVLACAGHVPVVFLGLSLAISGPPCPQKLSSLCKVVGKHYR